MEIKISQLNRNAADGLVTTVHWTAHQTEGDYNAYVYGALALSHKESSDSTFISFDKLTETNVIDWVKDKMGDEQLIVLQNNLNLQIESQKTAKLVIGIPWLPEVIPGGTPGPE